MQKSFEKCLQWYQFKDWNYYFTFRTNFFFFFQNHPCQAFLFLTHKLRMQFFLRAPFVRPTHRYTRRLHYPKYPFIHSMKETDFWADKDIWKVENFCMKGRIQRGVGVIRGVTRGGGGSQTEVVNILFYCWKRCVSFGKQPLLLVILSNRFLVYWWGDRFFSSKYIE